jgi:PAS domain-containing protein
MDRIPIEPRTQHQSWPLGELGRHFDLGCILSSAAIDAVQPGAVGALAYQHAGCWECELSDNSLAWSGGVFDIFGLPRSATITREECLGLYAESSRAVMESLRSYAISHRRGFTLDAEIHTVKGETRWMRLVAAPVCENDKVVKLHGLKVIIA